MKRKSIIFIIIITSIALAGIISMQLFWIVHAVELKEKQLEHRVSIALKAVINQLSEEHNAEDSVSLCMSACAKGQQVMTVIDPERLDSLLKDEFSNMCIDLDYKYGLYRKGDQKFLMGDYQNCEQQIMCSQYYTSLSCLMKDECILLGVYFPGEEHFLLKQMMWWLIMSAVFLLVVILSFSYVIMSLVRQKKLSEMKTDFMNNMTHEFKTPIATISLASEMLLKPSVNESAEKTSKYANIIYDENSRLKNQVEQVLQMAVLDRGTFKLKKEAVDIHEIIKDAAESFDLLIKQREGFFNLDLKATSSTLTGDPVHLSNIINNLLENANKYSHETPDITVKTWNADHGIYISIEDKGMGISSENQKHVFKKFYRVHTGNIHDVKGFGLGLYYVKTIVETHHGSITLHSELKKGSRFEIFLPLVQK